MNTKGVEDGIACEFCGTHCYHGAEHNARVEDNARFDDPKLPKPAEDGVEVKQESPEELPNGLSKVFGTWPGDENDAQLLTALDGVRGAAVPVEERTLSDEPSAKQRVLAVWPNKFAHQLIEGPWAVFSDHDQKFSTIKRWSPTEEAAWEYEAAKLPLPKPQLVTKQSSPPAYGYCAFHHANFDGNANCPHCERPVPEERTAEMEQPSFKLQKAKELLWEIRGGSFHAAHTPERDYKYSDGIYIHTCHICRDIDGFMKLLDHIEGKAK